jgi:hypothetical protein
MDPNVRRNGGMIMKKLRIFEKIVGLFLLLGILTWQGANVWAQSVDTKVDQPNGSVPDPWPRTIKAQGMDIMIYQPQIESWDGTELKSHAAVAVTPMGSNQPSFGVIWLTARTQVDKENETVFLDDLKITRGQFPKSENQGEEIVEVLRKQLPTETKTISLGRLEANLAISEAVKGGKVQPVKNDPPKIIFSSWPSILILVDGQPALREVSYSNFMRVVNTPALIVVDKSTGQYYLHLLKEWMQADQIQGPWAISINPPSSLDDLEDRFSGEVDLLNGDENTKLSAEQVRVYVSTTPAELVQTQGTPDLVPIENTELLYVRNTSSQIFMDMEDQYYYVLISGRWFRTESLRDGPWAYVPGEDLPEDFAKIPENHPSGAVLASVPGTEQAREAMIANSIPQTAQVRRDEASLDVKYDDEPKFEPIEGTALSYAVNTDTPVIQVDSDRYYAVDKGVWFVSDSPEGPWQVATSVPSEIYTIPVSSPLYYVTNVRVYGATPDYVNVGYTPGYYGTVVDPSGVVVYGTGYDYRPYIGSTWYSYPRTYGYGAGLSYGAATGFAFGFTSGLATGVWAHPRWGPTSYWRNADINRVSFNHANVYNRWGRNAVVRRSYPYSSGYARGYRDAGTNVTRQRTTVNNNVFSTRDGQLYRNTNRGWDRYDGGQWQRADKTPDWSNRNRSLNNEYRARSYGQARTSNFSSATRSYSSGGFSGGAYRGGYRSGSSSRQFARPSGGSYQRGGGGGYRGGGGGRGGGGRGGRR